MKKVLLVISLFASLSGAAQFFGDYSVQQLLDSTLRMEFYPTWPAEPFQVEKFNRHLSYDLYSDTVRFECLVVPDSTAAQYVITVDEWGGIHKTHVDSLLFSAPEESPMAPQQFNAEVAADYAIEKVEFLDVNNTAIDPTNGSAHYVRVKFTNGQTVTQPYIGRK